MEEFRLDRDPWPSFAQELANSLTHGVGVVLSVVGFMVLLRRAMDRGTTIHVVACSIYGASMVALYLASTLYHSLPAGKAKRVFRILDHSAIFLLIAGSYTPFTLISLKGPWGYSLFGIVWGMAIIGIVFESLFIGRYNKISLVLYTAMGWLVVVAAKPVLEALPLRAIGWLAAGGLCYTGGIVLYAWRGLKFHHAFWHVTVMGGSALQYIAVLHYVVS